jgi:hypothetical protein
MTVVIVTPLQLDLARLLFAQGMAPDEIVKRTRVPANVLWRAVERERSDDLRRWQRLGGARTA